MPIADIGQQGIALVTLLKERKMISGRKIALGIAALLSAAVMATSAHAATFTVSSSDGDGTLIGQAVFTFLSPTQLQLVLTNTNPNSGTKQGNTISGLDFQTNGFTLGALTSATATEGLISGGSAYDIGDSILTGTTAPDSPSADAGRWHEISGGIGALGGGQPSELLAANNSNVASQFDPSVDHSATFIFAISGVGANPTIGNSSDEVTFLFGTGPDASPTTPPSGCTGDNCNTGTPPGVPEPASLSVLGLGALSLMVRRRNRR
jgi:hypothetical protein